MKKIIINENQRGLLFKNGRFAGLLGAGRYFLRASSEVDICDISAPLFSTKCPLETLLSDKRIAESVSAVEVGDREYALHYVDGKFKTLLRHGKYAFWSLQNRHEFVMVDISKTEVSEDIPKYIFSSISTMYYTKVEVAEYQKARLYFDMKLERILDAGTYYFWKNGTKIDVGTVDTRLTQMNIVGQEILTQDKVPLRVNFVCSYRIIDPVRILTEIGDYEEQMHVCAQLAMREYIGRYKLDEILENKAEMSEFILCKLKARQAELFVEITDAGVKDVILPGEIRDIMNTVLVAEKRAQANVITRREEVASTRSLLNTARLMDENKTLYKLKELEYIERICENVGNITLNGNGDLLSQLTGVIRSGA